MLAQKEQMSINDVMHKPYPLILAATEGQTLSTIELEEAKLRL